MIEISCETLLPFIRPGWVGVEIGVSQGHSAVRLIKHGVRFMYLVDPWCWYDGIEGGGEMIPAEANKDGEKNYQECLAKLTSYQDRFCVLRMASAEAVRFIPQVDFVWVDGNHKYEWVKSDLESYWPKIKAGGVLCGHDYVNAGSCQVAKAVDEFAADRSRRLELALPCWVIQKVVW